MEITTVTLVGSTARERGTQLGAEQAESIRESTRLYLDFFLTQGLDESRVRAIAESCYVQLAEWAPSLAEELAATAEAADVELWQLAAVNARTEVLSVLPPETEGECSTAVFVPGGGSAPQTIQTWDWLHFLCPTGHLVEFRPDSRGERSTGSELTGGTAAGLVRMFTEPGVLGKIGVNDAGIGVHFNILHHTSDRGVEGVPVHAIARRVLDEATSIDEAEQIIRSARPSASTVLTVTQSAAGARQAACFEISPERVSVVLPGADGWLIHTNNFIAQDQLSGEATRDRSTTYARLAHLAEQQTAMSGLAFEERARGMCGEAGLSAPVCFTPSPDEPLSEQWATLMTIGLDLEAAAIDYYPGPPSELFEASGSRFGPALA